MTNKCIENLMPYQSFRNRDKFGMTTLVERRYNSHDNVTNVQIAFDIYSFGYDFSTKISTKRQRELHRFMQGQLLCLANGAQNHLAVTLWKSENVETWTSGVRGPNTVRVYLPAMRVSSGLTDAALMFTNTSLDPTMTGDLALLVSTRSSMVPYEWACQAIILDDHVVFAVVISSSAQMAAVVNLRRAVRAHTYTCFDDGEIANGRKTNRIAFDLDIILSLLFKLRSAAPVQTMPLLAGRYQRPADYHITVVISGYHSTFSSFHFPTVPPRNVKQTQTRKTFVKINTIIDIMHHTFSGWVRLYLFFGDRFRVRPRLRVASNLTIYIVYYFCALIVPNVTTESGTHLILKFVTMPLWRWTPESHKRTSEEGGLESLPPPPKIKTYFEMLLLVLFVLTVVYSELYYYLKIVKYLVNKWL